MLKPYLNVSIKNICGTPVFPLYIKRIREFVTVMGLLKICFIFPLGLNRQNSDFIQYAGLWDMLEIWLVNA
jgi:hypothetical protein